MQLAILFINFVIKILLFIIKFIKLHNKYTFYRIKIKIFFINYFKEKY